MADSQNSSSSSVPAPERPYALVTGASSGIGACFARALAARGRSVVLVARSKDKLAALKDEIASRNSVAIEVLSRDLSEQGAAAELVRSLTDRRITVDLLVNNAGFGAQGRFWELPMDRQSEMLRLNIVTLTELTHLLLPAMIGRRSGGVINVSSTAAFQPVPYLSVYAASKAYVSNFSMALAEEVSGYGIKVLALCPGGTATNFFDAGKFGKVAFVGGLQSPEEVVEVGLRAFDGGRTLRITRFVNRLTVFAQRLVPRRVATQIAGDMFRPKELKEER